MEYKEFKIIIQDPINIRIKSEDESDIKAELVSDDLRRNTIRLFDNLLAKGQIKRREDLEIIGQHLFNMLFGDSNVYGRLRHVLRKKSDKSGLRIVLEFRQMARELAALPWEFLYLPSTEEDGIGGFLAADPGLILARHVPVIAQKRPKEESLKILMVVSQPKDDKLAEVDANPVIREIKKLEKGVQHIITDRLSNPDKRAFEKKIADFKPHVLHFFGHGKYEKKHGYIALVRKKDNGPVWLRDDAFADLFKTHQPRLIFLHSCLGAMTDSYEGFRGLALQLVYSRIPAVVALRYPIENEVAIEFAKKFYQSLCEGMDIDEAVQYGRRELGMYLEEGKNFSSRAFGSPVVYLQFRDGIMFRKDPIPIPVIGEISSDDKKPVIKPETCPYPDCDAIVRAKFCGGCRRELMVCYKCGHTIAKELHYCDYCGIDVESEPPLRIPAPAVSQLYEEDGMEKGRRAIKGKTEQLPKGGF